MQIKRVDVSYVVAFHRFTIEIFAQFNKQALPYLSLLTAFFSIFENILMELCFSLISDEPSYSSKASGHWKPRWYVDRIFFALVSYIYRFYTTLSCLKINYHNSIFHKNWIAIPFDCICIVNKKKTAKTNILSCLESNYPYDLWFPYKFYRNFSV